MPYVGTSQGRLVDPLGLDIAESDPTILFKECASSIVKKNRYNGHTNRPYTVGQHTLILLSIADHFGEAYAFDLDNLRMTILLHDMHEAFTGDMPRPLKSLLPEYTAFEAKIAEKVKTCLKHEPNASALKFLSMVDSDICATWEMPVFGVGFFKDQSVTDVTLRTGVQLMLRALSYRDLIDPNDMYAKASDAAVDELIEEFTHISVLDWKEVYVELNRVYAELTERFAQRYNKQDAPSNP